MESRRAFRQKIHLEGHIRWGENLDARAPCRLEDISLVGVAFLSKAELQEGTEVVVSTPPLVKGGPSYDLPCTVVVRRDIAQQGHPHLWRYGCDYGVLDQRLEALLCKDIFALQAQSMNRE